MVLWAVDRGKPIAVKQDSHFGFVADLSGLAKDTGRKRKKLSGHVEPIDTSPKRVEKI